MDLEFLRFSQLDPEKVEEFVLRRRFPHSVEDLLPFVEKSFDIIILELELVQVRNVQEVEVFLALLEPLEKEDKYLSSFKLRSMLVHQFFFKNCHSARQDFRAYLFQSDCKFDVQAVETFGIVEHLIVRISFDLSNPREGAVRVTGGCRDYCAKIIPSCLKSRRIRHGIQGNGIGFLDPGSGRLWL